MKKEGKKKRSCQAEFLSFIFFFIDYPIWVSNNNSVLGDDSFSSHQYLTIYFFFFFYIINFTMNFIVIQFFFSLSLSLYSKSFFIKFILKQTYLSTMNYSMICCRIKKAFTCFLTPIGGFFFFSHFPLKAYLNSCEKLDQKTVKRSLRY